LNSLQNALKFISFSVIQCRVKKVTIPLLTEFYSFRTIYVEKVPSSLK